ncbi:MULTISPECIES: ATP-binding protein [Paenibacillus]|jgi:two-component system chemotaxis sensor kinase CheA|uniref:ATP-binding protein n=1 Tax=Paenibacillus TaxID=44249 RepID=UPI000491A481|nr:MULTISPECIES: ATP-binding protein [Paenibacillus]ALA40479.1 histidine kinase [Paenibacillus peoriae]APB77823.1 sensor histidine kinase [Paenibacillus polymyxa]MCP3746460.1 ATP-binding protein [Paenibacillus sp. A3M_27_13]ODB64052.1 histidine kinase [Paenibacillus polymyxa]OMF79046.1 sensor histidine kinase [Paenibacillus peoriae]
MQFSMMFLMNLGMLIAVAYVANVIYKYGLSRTSSRFKYVSSVLLVIFGGWVSSCFGFNFSETVIFDLRFVPLIIAALVYPRSYTLIIIGVAIGLTRFTFGLHMAAWVGFLNMSILGVLCAGLNYWMRRSTWRLIIKASVTILAVNIVNTLNIACLGVIPWRYYVAEVVPLTLPIGIVLSFLFALILRDFQMEQQRNHQIKQANELLSEQRDELQKAKVILEERAKQLMMASQYKSDFMATMSHELRTPLNSIINLAQIINEQGKELDEDELYQYSDLIYASGHDLLQMINDILDLSKVEAGHMEIVSEPVNVREIAQVMMMHFEVTAKDKNLEFSLKEHEPIPNEIRSDSKRVQQILRNLLSNAFKFTHEGRVLLEMSTQHLDRKGQEGDWVVFAVKDTGIGISKLQQHVIFEAFQQANGSINRKYGGTGLGLSISRDFSRLLGGFIRLESEEGKGSTFSLYLPMCPSVSKEADEQPFKLT